MSLELWSFYPLFYFHSYPLLLKAIMTKTPISAVIIAFNEADRIQATLKSLQFCEEILVVDSGSTDGTQAIAEKAGARVIHHAFEGYGLQNRFGGQEAKFDWILSIDADELLTEDLQQEIVAIFQSKPKESGFYIPRTLVFMGKKFFSGSEHKQLQLKLYNRTFGGYNDAIIHENIELSGSIGKLKGELLHFSYRSLSHYLEKFNDYTSKGAESLTSKGKKVSAFYILIRFPLAFVQQYWLSGNFLMGVPGFIWALLSAMYPVVKYAKRYEKQ